MTTWSTTSLGADEGIGFDVNFYANMNPDLIQAGLTSYAQLKWHWDNWGLREGRISNPNFHALSYSERYPDLKSAFKGDLVMLRTHYITHGFNEGRDASPSHIAIARLGSVSIAASTRCAGAVDSLWFGGREVVNSIDHGRQIQVACSDAALEGCFNPTQAGSASDGHGWPSTSQMLYRQAAGNVLHTKTRMAFWGRRDDSIATEVAQGCPPGSGVGLSDYICDTRYTLQQDGGATVINLTLALTCGSDVPANRFAVEILGAYVTPFFTNSSEVLASGQAVPRSQGGLNKSAEERPHPVLRFNDTGTHAIGIYCPTQNGTLTRYVTHAWPGSDTNASAKLGIVRRYSQPVSKGEVLSATAKLVVGGVSEVHRVLRGLV